MLPHWLDLCGELKYWVSGVGQLISMLVKQHQVLWVNYMPYKGNLTGRPVLPCPPLPLLVSSKIPQPNCIAPLRLPFTGESCCHCLCQWLGFGLCIAFASAPASVTSLVSSILRLLPLALQLPSASGNSPLQSHWQYLHYDCHFRRLQCWLNGQQFTRKASSIDWGGGA